MPTRMPRSSAAFIFGIDRSFHKADADNWIFRRGLLIIWQVSISCLCLKSVSGSNFPLDVFKVRSPQI